MEDAPAVAAVDCGTNSTRLLVVDETGRVAAREMTITRLGEGVDADQLLRPEAMERTFAALHAYRAVMDAEMVARARLVATSAVRDARNGSEFLVPAAEIIGVPAEVLSGEEEGRLSYAGATTDLPVGDPPVVLDIGGGSTEIVAGEGVALASVSLDIGCVRLTERFLHGDPPTGEEIDAARDVIAAELTRAAGTVPALARTDGGQRLVGLAGTVSTLAALELGLTRYDRDRIHHTVLTRKAVGRWCDVLAAESLAERGRRPGLPEGRQDVIFGGALVLHEFMDRFDFDECIVSESDILDGLVLSVLD